MSWVTAIPPGGDRSFNECLVLVDRYRKTPMLLQFHKDDTAMDKTIMIWNGVISNTGLLKNITILKPDGLAEIMIQNLEEMIRIFCAYGLEFKDSDCFTHSWCTSIPTLELAYKTSIHSSTGKTPEIL
ncbi:hypothetical protein O181_049986 [Austropuccinia psidii MF-1]|uniref:Uncharacterized protein n=1 Tax=Austropuccinia psidii MF-1 TaxID=1389203 RepID=A0A9Q3DTF6_9BASI|nr:hypothetical protein [Austropuccinia psidii MF-1]